MAKMRDKAGRPVVVVTGSGLVTSLGAGKAENWNGSPRASPAFARSRDLRPTVSRPRMAGTVDFLDVEPYTAPDLSERLAEMAIEEAVAEAGIGSRRHFPGPLFLAVAPIEIEWPQREALVAALRRR